MSKFKTLKDLNSQELKELYYNFQTYRGEKKKADLSIHEFYKQFQKQAKLFTSELIKETKK